MESQAAQLSPLFVFGQLMLESAPASERGSWRQAFSAIFRSSGLGALPAWPPSGTGEASTVKYKKQALERTGKRVDTNQQDRTIDNQ